MPLAELALTSVLVCDFALGPLGLLLNPSQADSALLPCELPFQFPAVSLQTKKILFFRQIERGSPMGRQCRENGEVTCLPQGHLALAQLDSCSDDLLSDAIMRWRWRLFWMLSVQDKKLAALGLVAVRSPASPALIFS